MSATSLDFFNDAVGEIGNMMMGAGATNLAGLVGAPVTITTPRIDDGASPQAYAAPRSVVVSIDMSGSAVGHSVFVLPTEQVVELVKLMTQGMDVPEEDILGEFGMSAIGEAMNQLIAGAARALNEILGGTVDISPPHIELIDRADLDFGLDQSKLVTVSFEVTIGNHAMGQLAWLMERDFASDLIARIETNMGGGAPAPAPAPPAAVPPAGPPASGPPAPVPARPAPPVAAAPVHEPSPAPDNRGYAPHVQQVTFPELRHAPAAASQADLAKLADVTLNVTVELGRTRLKVRELLALGAGSVVELDRVAGAPVDILVNGTLVARGDVVVVDDELGVRVSEVIDPANRKA